MRGLGENDSDNKLVRITAKNETEEEKCRLNHGRVCTEGEKS